jgi:hypothetical protein
MRSNLAVLAIVFQFGANERIAVKVLTNCPTPHIQRLRFGVVTWNSIRTGSENARRFEHPDAFRWAFATFSLLFSNILQQCSNKPRPIVVCIVGLNVEPSGLTNYAQQIKYTFKEQNDFFSRKSSDLFETRAREAERMEQLVHHHGENVLVRLAVERVRTEIHVTRDRATVLIERAMTRPCECVAFKEKM